MAMTANAMASKIIGDLNKADKPGDAINKFYKALCDYVESNMQIMYSWAATMPPPTSTPDPQVLLDCKVKTAGSMSPNGKDTPDGALAQFSTDLNTQAATWQVEWPSGFTIPPAFIIPTINITPSMKDNQQDAWIAVCTQIINGLKAATPGPLAGTHGSYTVPSPGAVFTQIL